jgi:hypothetical protein
MAGRRSAATARSARLDGKEVLDEDRAVRLTKDGELPPFMVLGLDTGADILTSPPETQESALDKFNLTLFADFRIAEKLAFRVGVPLEGEATARSRREARCRVGPSRSSSQRF